MRTGVLLVALSLVAWSAPTALANDGIPLCSDVTVNPAAVEDYYLYEDDSGNVEVWEETNEMDGLQREECKVLVDEEAEAEEDRYDKEDSDLDHAAVPIGDMEDDVEDDVDDAISDIEDTEPPCIDTGGSTMICIGF